MEPEVLLADVDQGPPEVAVPGRDQLVLPAAVIGRVGRVVGGRDRGAEEADAEANAAPTEAEVMRGSGGQRSSADGGGGGDGDDGLAEHGVSPGCGCDARHILHISRDTGAGGSKPSAMGETAPDWLARRRCALPGNASVFLIVICGRKTGLHISWKCSISRGGSLPFHAPPNGGST